MPDSHTRWQETLRVLGASYAAQLPEKIQQIETAWDALQRTWDEETLRTLHLTVHGLTGSGATFGFAEISHAAQSLERTIEQLEKQAVAASAAQRAVVAGQIAELRQVALTGSRAPGS